MTEPAQDAMVVSEVEVAVDPDAAFVAFTEELDLWWARVTPKWFGPWCARRGGAPREVRDLARLALGVSYARPAAAARWLDLAFGFTSPDPLPEGPDPLPGTGYGHPWIEFRLGNSSLMIFEPEEGPRAGGCTCPGSMSMTSPGTTRRPGPAGR